MTSPATLLARGRRKLNASLPLQTLLLVLMLLAMFGPLLNLLIWTVAESWFFPHALPSQWGLKYWYQVFSPYSDVSGSLLTSVLIAVLSVLVCLLISIPAGYALSRRGMPLRVGFMLLFLIPQAFPNLTVYMNIARLFYQWGLNGTVAGVVLVHSVHGLMYSVWICVAAFSAVDPLLARASRNLGAGGGVYVLAYRFAPGIAGDYCRQYFCLSGVAGRVHRHLFLSARRISPRCRCCYTTPACRETIRCRLLLR
ncbi:ABC-type maltose transport systems, permease component [Raoultella terrigena]|uniref:ABC-type maltose transport systems, permease component n=1 Tax=Raoultella terrigena TaxID=577 RepID=A0A3P8J886_RAOTE|nr:ABC-type maltose transport systems, permease component [Raoultella terrigena]